MHFKRSFLKHLRNVKVTPNEECVTQHKLLVADIEVNGHPPKSQIVPPRRKVWKLRDSNIRKEYETFVSNNSTDLSSNQDSLDVNLVWNEIKACLLKGVDQVCG